MEIDHGEEVENSCLAPEADAKQIKSVTSGDVVKQHHLNNKSADTFSSDSASLDGVGQISNIFQNSYL